MKKLILLFTVLAFIGCKEEVIINAVDMTYEDGLFYLKHDMSLVNGIVKELFENGKLRSEATFKDGKPNGGFKRWYENGQLAEQGTNKDGEFDGGFNRWHENGQLEAEWHWKDGKEDGVWKEWYDNGQLMREMNFKDNELIYRKEWDEDGNEQ